MSRLIDADVFVEAIKGVEVTWYLDGNYETYDDTTIMDIIEEQPTVEAVPVVHCRDCEYWHKETGWCQWHSHFINGDGNFCHPWESNDWKMFGENDFCSDGKLRSSAKKSAKKIME